VFQIGGNTFYDQKNKILMKIPEFKRSGIGLIAELRGIPSRFPNQGFIGDHTLMQNPTSILLPTQKTWQLVKEMVAMDGP
jgi:hypothetical protein